MLPLTGFSPQNLHTIEGVGDGLPFFWRSTVIHGEHALTFVYCGLRCLNSLLHLRPIGFKQSRPVRFVPTIFHSHVNLGNAPAQGKTTYVLNDAISQKPKTDQFYTPANTRRKCIPLSDEGRALASAAGILVARHFETTTLRQQATPWVVGVSKVASGLLLP
jgi:hypothetical protein